ncbi:HlyIII-domain-containing protein [Auriscalpium vulgare]|uniref:HlyIII-domain-containing protein n=1 Tax=Auriscalpium vulgare TaxID=40419 RepID=A0ACB8S887_9AGAM|nr:HlyIII-domain-containing protein [Auriscalpium vulgare]
MSSLSQRHVSKDPLSSGHAKDGLRPTVDGGPPLLTVSWAELPEWMRDNEYILTGYRRELKSWRGCAGSVFGYLHNETVNIHSHLGAAFLFVGFLATFDSTYFRAHASVTWVDRAVFAIFLSSAVFCLLSSAFYHMSSAHSEPIAAQCHAFDYSGIIVLTVGSFYPCIYYGFYCDQFYKVAYLSLITASGLGAAYIVLDPDYARPSHRGARTTVFIALGLSGVLPVSHALVSHGFYTLCQEMGFQWLLASGALYIIGALLYANRFPERLAPGKFDIWFASHQIFHVFVVLAALAHYVCILTAFDHWHSRRSIC